MKRVRLKANLSQTELAKRLKLSQTDISNIESGKEYPSQWIRNAIDRTLKTNIDWSKCSLAPLSDIEKTYLTQIYERMIQNGEGTQETMKFLANQNNADLRKLFKFAGVVIKPMSANGYDYGKRKK